MDKNPGPKQRINLFGYLDETGLLHTPATDKVFGLGLLVCQNPKQIHRDIINFKNKKEFRKEFKFTDIRAANLPIYKGLVDIFFNCGHINFSCVVYDKKELDINKYFRGDHERAYSAFAARLVANALEDINKKGSGYIAILADDVSTSKSDKFEKVVRESTKKRLRRNAVFGIARLESHAVSEIQLCDVLLGIVAYAFKVRFGLVRAQGAKLEMVKYLQKKLGAPRLSESIQAKKRGGVHVFIEEYHTNKK